MPLWLDLLRTPMAAPETRFLAVLRYMWQGLCLTLASSIFLLRPLQQLLGQIAPIFVGGLLVLTITHTLIYLRIKCRADNAYLAAAGGTE